VLVTSRDARWKSRPWYKARSLYLQRRNSGTYWMEVEGIFVVVWKQQWSGSVCHCWVQTPNAQAVSRVLCELLLLHFVRSAVVIHRPKCNIVLLI
jgi:hypothetical protein